MDAVRLAYLIVTAILLIAVGTAAAAASVCDTLEAQLSALNRPALSYDPGLDGRILQQRRDLDLLTVRARKAGCVGGLLSLPAPEESCASLMLMMGRLQANLSRLTAEQRVASPDPYTAEKQRANVLRLLASNNCGDPYADNPPVAQAGAFARIFGGQSSRSGFGANGDYYDDYSDGGLYSLGPSTYRTLCVRTCDGYYFPISFSTVPSRFPDDERTCAAMCPGAEVTLYVEPSPGGDASQMESLSGEPYTALPSAFAYRKQYNPACSCRSASAQYTPVPGQNGGASAAPESSGGAHIDGAAPAPLSPNPDDPKRNVRVVGPSYYVAQ